LILTAEQFAAVDTARSHMDACITAGPGSGKTTVLVEYFRRLVERGNHPQRILAITFTEKAAANMRKKLAEAFREDPRLRAALERSWVSTVHGFCARLLKENAIFAGLDPDFYVTDERESYRQQQEAMAAAVSAMFAEHPDAVRALIRGLATPEFEELLISAYDAMRGAGMAVEEMAVKAPAADDPEAELAQALAELRADPLTGWNPAQKLHLKAICRDLEAIAGAAGPREVLQAIEAYSGNLQQLKAGSQARNRARTVRHLLERLTYFYITVLYEKERATLVEIVRRFDGLYRERKRALGALDFADLEEQAVRLLSDHPEIRAQVQAQFEHVLMDEFQDTNGQQARLVRLVRRADRFYAVGDVNQSIYGFRHAEPEVFRGYREDVAQRGCRVVDLAGNFRSRPDILRAVESIVGHGQGIEPRRLTAERIFAQPRPVAVELINVLGPDADEALRGEARWVARRIQELVRGTDASVCLSGEGAGEKQSAGEIRNGPAKRVCPTFAFKDIAVLVRNTEVIPQFTEAFEEAGIPYAVHRSKGFFDAREVKDLYHLLRAIANPRDEVSLAAVLRSPLVAASDEALLSLRLMGGNIGEAIMRLDAATDLTADDHEKLVRFRDRMRAWRVRRELISFDRLLADAIDDCGYQSERQGPGWMNIEKFLAQAREASSRMSLDDFVELVSRLRDDNVREPEAPPEDATDAVAVMTVHSAKGLEFPVVFVAALHKGIETSTPVVAFSRHYGLGARWRNPATGEDKSDLLLHSINEERKQRETEESHRLLYVAMTRAEQHLGLSFSGKGKPKNWAKTVTEELGLSLDSPRDEVLTVTAPDGQEWKMRVFVTAEAPTVWGGASALPPAFRPARPGEDVQFLALPAVSDQHDANATVTAVATFAKCPREYYLGHYLGFEGRPAAGRDRRDSAKDDGPGAAASASEFGNMVHALLARPGGAGDRRSVPDLVAGVKATAMAEVFKQSALGRRAARANRVEREFDFLMAVEGLLLRGQIDLWFEEGGETIIVDYKTDAVNSGEAHQRAQDYAMQLRLYALAVERMTGRPVDHAWLYFLAPNTAIEVDLRPSLLDSPEQVVREFQEAQDRLEFPLREGRHCTRCQFFKYLCPSAWGGSSAT
jgi:ATP-dependent exoDNAse (exonuclease V) beta subunit